VLGVYSYIKYLIGYCQTLVCCSFGFRNRNQKLWIRVQSTRATCHLWAVCTCPRHR